MKTKLISVWGIVLLTVFFSGCSVKTIMVKERVSPYNVDKTIDQIKQNAKSIGWVVPDVKNMNKSIKKHGAGSIGGPVRIVELCNATHASKILKTDEGRYAALLMPCAVAVYTKSDGKTYVSSMKAGTVGGLMGGVVADVMQDVDTDQKKILGFLPD